MQKKMEAADDSRRTVFRVRQVSSGLTSHQQRGNTETEPRFKVSSERPEKRGSISRSLDW